MEVIVTSTDTAGTDLDQSKPRSDAAIAEETTSTTPKSTPEAGESRDSLERDYVREAVCHSKHLLGYSAETGRKFEGLDPKRLLVFSRKVE
ncbi:MAG: hypothetical protein OXR73_28110, partial [Myxococcales bacterium]|nr:hypothetical protein [Myxococcales bacterium]